jgi:hypothetical protein
MKADNSVQNTSFVHGEHAIFLQYNYKDKKANIIFLGKFFVYDIHG